MSVIIFPAINGQSFSFNNVGTGIVFPGAGISDTLASFKNPQKIPQISVPQSFLLAARSIKVPTGKMKGYAVFDFDTFFSHKYLYFVNI